MLDPFVWSLTTWAHFDQAVKCAVWRWVVVDSSHVDEQWPAAESHSTTVILNSVQEGIVLLRGFSSQLTTKPNEESSQHFRQRVQTFRTGLMLTNTSL